MNHVDSHGASRRWHARFSALIAAGILATIGMPVAARSDASTYIECQHPVRTGVEVYRLHHITSRAACPVALALFRWEATGQRESSLYGCHGPGHAYLRTHHFHGWRLSLTPEFVMSRNGASFAVGGTDFPVSCT